MVDIAIVIFYLVVTTYIGLSFSKNIKNSSDFETGGKNYNYLVIFATLSASFIGGGFTSGLAEKVYIYGLIFVIAIWGFSIKEILIAYYIAPKFAKLADEGVATTGDIMERFYGKNARILTGIASILVCGGIIGAQFTACGNILYSLLGIDPKIATIITAIIIIIYTAYGGLKAVVAADILHFTLLTIMIPLTAIFGIYYLGGIEEFLVKFSEIKQIKSSLVNIDNKINFTSFIILFISFFLGETLIPPYVQRLLIGRTIKDTVKGTLFSGLLSFIFFLCVGLIGIIALLINQNLEPYLALPFVFSNVLPIGLKGLAVAGMMAVIMSSADSFLNATAISFNRDIIMPLNKDNNSLGQNRVITGIIGIIAMLFALYTKSALDILLYSYQFWTPFILVPLLSAIYGFKSNSKSLFISAAAGVCALLFWNITKPFAVNIDGALEGVIFGVVINFIVFISMNLYYNKLEKEKVKAGI